jgi:hypothetical protein
MAPPAAPPMDQATTHRPPLWWACARGVTTWQLGCTTGMAPRPRARTMAAGDVPGLEEARTRATRW